LNKRGGFDAIITNPPWETFQPDAKEFFAEHSDLVTKKSMDIHDFEAEQARLLRDPEVMKAWLDYHSRFNHQRHYFRVAPEYVNQVPIIDGKRHGKDVNLFKLFLERCVSLLRDTGECGIVIPSGIYTDLGAMKLREMLFNRTQITGLFGFENRKEIFESVHRSFKFVVLTLKKGGHTVRFPAAFMRHDVSELSDFARYTLNIPVEMIRRLSPDSLSVMEFKNELDVAIAEKMLHWPLLGTAIPDTWNVELHREFNMTDDAALFDKTQKAGHLPLFEGKMIWQFNHRFSDARYWISEKKAREALLPSRIRRLSRATEIAGRLQEIDKSRMTLDYEHYRLGYRDIASSTNERSMICTVLPRRVFAGNTLNLQRPINDLFGNGHWKEVPWLSASEMAYLCAVFNSFTIDWMIRQKITSHLNMFYVYQLPIPRLSARDAASSAIVERASRLICTTPEFDELAREVGLQSHRGGVTDIGERAKLCAELDGLIAHLYGLTEGEFGHVLGTFPLVAASVKDAAMEAYRRFAPKTADQEVAAVIQQGEGRTVEFKSSARWDMKQNQQSKAMEQVIVKTAAAFLNSTEGGTLLIGVDDDGKIVGLTHDYKTLGKRQNRDGFENWLTTLLLDQFGKDAAPFVQLSFHDMGGQDVCRVLAKAAPRPCYVKDGQGEHLFVRTNNSTRQLTTKEAVDYCKHRWP
jgi:Putative DNA-binding domain